MPSNLQHFRIFISVDGRAWVQLLDHQSDGNFGGAWGEPMIVTISGGETTARFFRIELGGPGVLHLDQVKIFGSALTRN